MYRLLTSLQRNHQSCVNFNWDDQSRFRLDSTFTNKQFPSLGVNQSVTTRTDFLNKHSTETCVGIVKGSLVHQKSPSRHMADLNMLERSNGLQHLFKDKEVEFVRIDGESDGEPSHLEVQFLWTERHLVKKTNATVITA